MSLFKTLSKTFTALTGNTLPVRMARECGWPILFREGCGVILQVSVDQSTAPRQLMVVLDEPEIFVQFDCFADLGGTVRAVPDELCAFLLDRNAHATFGAWHISHKSGTVKLSYRYRALVGGLSTVLFKIIGLRAVKEVAEVEALLHQKGWI